MAKARRFAQGWLKPGWQKPAAANALTGGLPPGISDPSFGSPLPPGISDPAISPPPPTATPPVTQPGVLPTPAPTRPSPYPGPSPWGSGNWTPLPPSHLLGPDAQRPGWGGTAWPVFSGWHPQGSPRAAGWDQDWNFPVPSGDDEGQILEANFVNWLNQMMPFLSPRDFALVANNLGNSLDRLELTDEQMQYIQGLGEGTETPMENWNVDVANLWDKERLREMLRATNALGGFFPEEVIHPGAAGEGVEPQPLREGEDVFGDISNLLNDLLDVWQGSGPMSRRERTAYQDQIGAFQAGLPQEYGMFGDLLGNLLNPYTPTARLSSLVGAPQSFGYNPYGYNRGAGYQNPIYL